MAKLTVADIADLDAAAIGRMSRKEVERLVLEAAEMVRRLATGLDANSADSTPLPSGDPSSRGGMNDQP
jgi:hypothetical protein